MGQLLQTQQTRGELHFSETWSHSLTREGPEATGMTYKPRSPNLSLPRGPPLQQEALHRCWEGTTNLEVYSSKQATARVQIGTGTMAEK